MTPDVDVLVSNAVLHWVPGHQEMIARWAEAASPGTWIGWQVPGNFGAPSHVLMRELAGSAKWADRLGGVLRHREAVSEPAEYLALLGRAGFRADAWETTYLHVLRGPDAVLNWVRGTALRPVLGALDPAGAGAFEAEYAVLLREAYPETDQGTIFPFRRIFCVGEKAYGMWLGAGVTPGNPGGRPTRNVARWASPSRPSFAMPIDESKAPMR
jgi:trans-aconitate 2-methyltransferase